jgi:predicted transcriptional regulator
MPQRGAAMKTLNVQVEGHHMGIVAEHDESLARSKFGVADDEFAAMGSREKNDVRNFGILPDVEFAVLLA